MSKFDRIAIVAAIALALGTGVAAANNYRLGRTATPQEIAGWDIEVLADGTGLPAGQGSVSEGEGLYEKHCAMCHGTFGESSNYIPIAGGGDRTVGKHLNAAPTLYDYINRAMPYPHSKSLSPNEVYAIAAYVLNLNDRVPADFVANKDTLPKVEMPAATKYVLFEGLMKIDGKPDTHNTACMKDCAKDVKVTARLPDGFVESMYGDIRDNFNPLYTMNTQAPPASAAATASAEGGGDAKGWQLVQDNGCTACHGLKEAVVGPGFRMVYEKYKADPEAASKHLHQKIHEGGSGVWGQVPMPPQPNLSAGDLDTIVKWLLAGAPDK
ncbi:c-type cytochrome [Thermomonas flagellata]|uniref:c-type cytochrome n=1 Tax=Thermomonas flagellata TaxID=2888524 RepID=UPI001F039026|nr:c-type cytochrome [Thermomonas flagellata]